MSENIRVENWCGYDIRFVEYEGSWYAVLKDICDALELRTDNTKRRIDAIHTEFLSVPYLTTMAEGLNRGRGEQEFRQMLCVDEAGIYQALSRSTRLEARKFIDWISHSLVDLRKAIGLEGYEALRLTESTIQEAISKKIDIPYVEPTGDIIPVKAEPTIVQNITNVTNVKNIDYRKAAIYTGAGVIVGGIVVIGVYHGVKYVVKKRKAKKSKED